MNTWIWIEGKAWTHEYEYGPNPWTHEFQIQQTCEPMDKNPWNREYEYWHCYELMNMNMNFSWNREYEYWHVAPWTFKSSYSSRKSMNHPMNSMNCNAWNSFDCINFWRRLCVRHFWATLKHQKNPALFNKEFWYDF